MPDTQAIDIAEIRDFLGERGYKLQMNRADTDIWRKSGGEIVWECTVESYNEALKRGLNHWLCEQLGIHWQRLYAWQEMRHANVLEAFDDEHADSIEGAIAWHELLSKELS